MDETRPSLRKHIPQLGLLLGVVFCTFYSRLLISPLLLTVSEDLDVSYARATSLFLLTSVGYVLTLLCSGFISERITHHWTIVTAAVLTSISLALIGLSQTIATLSLGFVMLGMGPGLYPASGIPMVTRLVGLRHLGTGMAMVETGISLAFILTPFLAALLLPVVSWRVLFLGSAGFVGMIAYLNARLGKTGRFRGTAPNYQNLNAIFRNRAFWGVTCWIALFSASTIGIFAILPSFLVLNRGMNQEFINAMIGASRISGLFILFIAAYLGDRWGRRKLVILVYVFSGFFTYMLGAAEGNLLLLCVFLQPLFAPAFFPSTFALLSESVSRNHQNVAIALAIAFGNIFGVGVFPFTMGLLETAGHATWGFMGLGILMLACLPMMLLFRPRAPSIGATRPEESRGGSVLL
jgi:NNP family nitrate/nitrite transporter-like MFS transporter